MFCLARAHRFSLKLFDINAVARSLVGNSIVALILIADDDELIVDLVCTVLGRQGHVVSAVDDVWPVLQLLAAQTPALLILDYTMPKVSGIEVLRRVRGAATFSSLPILMLTGRCGEQDEQLALASGANDYLRKPFDPTELVVRVSALLERARLHATDRALIPGMVHAREDAWAAI